VATLQDCERALHALADRLADTDPRQRGTGFDRTLSCSLTDLHAVFGGRLKDGLLVDIAPVKTADAQIRLTMTSDDLVAMVNGKLKMSSAWATGRIKVDAGIRDMMRLRALF
jgi:SCP-2 sterol transfer family